MSDNLSSPPPPVPSAPSAPRPSAPTRRHGRAHGRLLAAAATLFYQDGIGATGIDSIVARAGVARKSLYNNFASKAELIDAYLMTRHAEWLALYEARLRQAHDPATRVLAVFEAYGDHANGTYERGFRGCGLLNAAAEFPAGDPSRAIVRRHKEEVQSILATHLHALLPQQPQQAVQLAQHLAFLLEGAIVRAGLEGHGQCVAEAQHLAAGLLAQAAGHSAGTPPAPPIHQTSASSSGSAVGGHHDADN